MNWLLPSALGVAGGAAVLAFALHFIARSRPAAETLPTARFVPDRPVHARTRSIALSDLPLLLLRLAALLVLGAAVAGPVAAAHGRVTRIVLADRSRAVASAAEVRDSVRALVRPGDVVIPFDSAAVARADAAALLDSLGVRPVRGSLSAALAAAAGAAASAESDSLEIVVISPFAREEMDAATARLRAAWPGRIRLVPVAAGRPAGQAAPVELRGDPEDAVLASIRLAGASSLATVRVVRGPLEQSDSLWVREAGHVLVHWPASDDAARTWRSRRPVDAIGAVAAGGTTVVARFPRLWTLDGRAVARWADGEPAAVEHAAGAGCIRDVGVLVDEGSDVALGGPFQAFARAMLAPCGGARALEPVDSAARLQLAGAGPLASAASVRGRDAGVSQWTPWLLALGAALLFAELVVRRSVRSFA